MLRFSPVFGAIWSTLIMLVYASIEADINMKDIGTILKVFPITFVLMALISYVLFIPLKLIFIKENRDSTHFKEMWRMFFVILFSIATSACFGMLSYYFEGIIVKAFIITIALSASTIFTYSFYVSLSKQLTKK